MKSKPVILIVDDNDDAREVLAMILDSSGYRTAQASNGAEAVELARQIRPDVIVTDVYMPELDGVRASEAIRREPGLADVPIIAQTAKPSSARARAALFFEILTKPCDPEAILDSLQRAISGPPAAAAPSAPSRAEPASLTC
jgi:two-component system cell cycle response regulator DivK